MKTTTLNRIQELSPLEENWKALLKGLGKTKADNKPLAYAAILEIWGLDGALWAAGAEPQYNWRLLAISFARRVQHLTSDQRVSDCLDIAERVSLGKATTKNLDAAIMAANEASREASRACLAAPRNAKLESAQESTWAACRAASKVPAWDAARAAACDAARAAAWDVLRSAHPENGNAVWDAAVWDSAIDAEIKEQKKMFLEFVKNELVAARFAPVEDEELVEIGMQAAYKAEYGGDMSIERAETNFVESIYKPMMTAAIAAIRPHIEAAALSDLVEFSKHKSWSLNYKRPFYYDDDDLEQCWIVYEEIGPINDRDWNVIGKGETAAKAIAAALKNER